MLSVELGNQKQTEPYLAVGQGLLMRDWIRSGRYRQKRTFGSRNDLASRLARVHSSGRSRVTTQTFEQ